MVELALIIVLCILFLESQPKELLSDRSYIRLYDDYRATSPVREFSPASGNYIDYTFPVDLKKLEINLSRRGDGRDASRYIELYAVYSGNTVASDIGKTGSVDMYTLAHQSNYIAYTPKYKKIISIRAGQHATLELVYPVKSIMVRAAF
jgi:hypothetical protein